MTPVAPPVPTPLGIRPFETSGSLFIEGPQGLVPPPLESVLQPCLIGRYSGVARISSRRGPNFMGPKGNPHQKLKLIGFGPLFFGRANLIK